MILLWFIDYLKYAKKINEGFRNLEDSNLPISDKVLKEVKERLKFKGLGRLYLSMLILLLSMGSVSLFVYWMTH